MQFIRSEIENRNVFMIVLITFLCISFLSVTTLIYAAAPLLILGIPAAKFIWGVVSVGLTAYSAYQLAKSLIPDLERDIKNLNDDILRLDSLKDDSWDHYQERRVYLVEAKAKLTSAESALTAAKEATEDAKEAESSAKSQYEGTSYYHDWAQKAYMNHTAESSTCTGYGSYLCSEGTRLYNEWQTYAKQMKTDKKAYDDAKDALKEAEKEESKKYNTWRSAAMSKDAWEYSANVKLSTYRRIKKQIEGKASALKGKEIELAVNRATVELAKGNVSGAKKELTDIREKYPDAWAQAISEDAELSRKIDEVLNYETE